MPYLKLISKLGGSGTDIHTVFISDAFGLHLPVGLYHWGCKFHVRLRAFASKSLDHHFFQCQFAILHAEVEAVSCGLLHLCFHANVARFHIAIAIGQRECVVSVDVAHGADSGAFHLDGGADDGIVFLVDDSA